MCDGDGTKIISICEHQGHCFIKRGFKIIGPCTVCGAESKK